MTSLKQSSLMAFSKSHLFDKADQSTSSFNKALSHPARLDILRQLADHNSCSVDFLKKLYPLSKSTVSQHLQSLRDIGLVSYREDYPRIFYYLNEKNLRLYIDSLLSFLQELESQINRGEK
jgi:DNA-binding transcriptional ArsR family regulator